MTLRLREILGASSMATPAFDIDTSFGAVGNAVEFHRKSLLALSSPPLSPEYPAPEEVYLGLFSWVSYHFGTPTTSVVHFWGGTDDIFCHLPVTGAREEIPSVHNGRYLVVGYP